MRCDCVPQLQKRETVKHRFLCLVVRSNQNEGVDGTEELSWAEGVELVIIAINCDLRSEPFAQTVFVPFSAVLG